MMDCNMDANDSPKGNKGQQPRGLLHALSSNPAVVIIGIVADNAQIVSEASMGPGPDAPAKREESAK